MIVIPDARLIEPVLEIVTFDLVDLSHHSLIVDPTGPPDYLYMAPEPTPTTPCTVCRGTGKMLWYFRGPLFDFVEQGHEDCWCQRIGR